MAYPTEYDSTKTEVELRAWNSTSWREVGLDSSTRTLQSIDYVHHEIHAGSNFFVSGVVNLSINQVYDLRFTTPNTTKYSHWTWKLDVESKTTWYVYEGAVAKTSGTAITPLNNNRNSSTTSVNTLNYQISNTLASANLRTTTTGKVVMLQGIAGAGNKTLGSETHETEIVLKKNTTYCMRAVATAAGFVDFLMEWYEHTDKNETGAVW